MVDSLPPSGTDPDNKTIISNSNGKLSVPLDDEFLAVGSSGKVEVVGPTQYYLANFEQDSGDWTGIDSVSDLTRAIVLVDDESELPKSASVTADLTGIDVLTFKIDVDYLQVKIKFDGIKEATINDTVGFQTLEISGLDHYGTNTTVEIEAYDIYDYGDAEFKIAWVRGSVSQPESRKIELVDTGGL